MSHRLSVYSVVLTRWQTTADGDSPDRAFLAGTTRPTEVLIEVDQLPRTS